MFDITLIKELSEIIGKSLKFIDIEGIGKYFFKDYSSHKINKTPETHTISNLLAAKTIVNYCLEKGKLEDLIKFIIELDGNLLNGKTINITGLENFLYALSRSGYYYDFKTRKFVNIKNDNKNMCNWGSLISGKEYMMIIASLDICSSSQLVKKYKSNIIEKVYFLLWEYVNKKIDKYDGRIWSWAGDGGIIAFRTEFGINAAVCCLLEILFSLPVFNGWESKPISDEISLRIGANLGFIKFQEDTGRIISDVINFASHLEKKATQVNNLTITDEIYNNITSNLKKIFKLSNKFEDKIIYNFNYNYKKLF